MFKRLWPSLLVCTAAASFSAPALAQGYFGLGLGANFYNDAETWGIEDESSAFEVKGGVRLVDVLAVEMSYLNLGEFRDFAEERDIGFSGVTLSGKAILPLGDQMDVYAKMGLFFWELDEKWGRTDYFLDEGEDLIFGVGASFYVTEQVSVDLEYRALEMLELESELFTVGISFSF